MTLTKEVWEHQQLLSMAAVAETLGLLRQVPRDLSLTELRALVDPVVETLAATQFELTESQREKLYVNSCSSPSFTLVSSCTSSSCATSPCTASSVGSAGKDKKPLFLQLIHAPAFPSVSTLTSSPSMSSTMSPSMSSTMSPSMSPTMSSTIPSTLTSSSPPREETFLTKSPSLSPSSSASSSLLSFSSPSSPPLRQQEDHNEDEHARQVQRKRRRPSPGATKHGKGSAKRPRKIQSIQDIQDIDSIKSIPSRDATTTSISTTALHTTPVPFPSISPISSVSPISSISSIAPIPSIPAISSIPPIRPITPITSIASITSPVIPSPVMDDEDEAKENDALMISLSDLVQDHDDKACLERIRRQVTEKIETCNSEIQRQIKEIQAQQNGQRLNARQRKKMFKEKMKHFYKWYLAYCERELGQLAGSDPETKFKTSFFKGINKCRFTYQQVQDRAQLLIECLNSCENPQQQLTEKRETKIRDSIYRLQVILLNHLSVCEARESGATPLQLRETLAQCLERVKEYPFQRTVMEKMLKLLKGYQQVLKLPEDLQLDFDFYC